MTQPSTGLIGRIGRWIRGIIISLLIGATGWIGGTTIFDYMQTMGVFDLRRVEIRGNNILTRAEVAESMGLPVTGSVFDVDLYAIKQRVELLNYVYGVRLGRKLPHILFVDVVENQPLAYVAASEYFVITRERSALPLPHGRLELELPTITGADSALDALALGTVAGHGGLDQAWQTLDYIHTAHPSLYTALSELVLEPTGELTLYMSETSTAVRLGDRDLERRIAVLDAFLLTVRQTRSLQDYAYIDLRYDRQVVVKERA